MSMPFRRTPPIARPISALALLIAWATGCRTPPPAAPGVTVEQPAAAAGLPPKAAWRATASAVQEDLFPASAACDGRMDTRWSSPASDPQWLQLDFGVTTTVCGATLAWENAFSSEYSIQVSPDGTAWTTVYQTVRGDGHTDEVFFRPTPARCLRVTGAKRGTGWGHSIWEVDVKGPDACVRTDAAGSDPFTLFDGRMDTGWTSAGPAPIALAFDFQSERPLGGIRIDWGANYARDAALCASRDGSAWSRVAELKDGTGSFDILSFPRLDARMLRLEVSAAAGAGPVDLREVTLRGPDETLTPQTLYEIAAEKSKPGLYPDWLRKRQVYWTLTGIPGDRQESLLDEYGNLEPVAGGSCVMPYVFSGGELLSAFDAKAVTPSLDDGYLPLPAVTWDLGTLSLTVEAVTSGGTDNSITYARYRLSNPSDQPQAARLFLAIRPLQINPPWQYGGLSEIRSLEFADAPEGGRVRVNGADRYVTLTPPAGFGARAFDQGDIVRDLARGALPAAARTDDTGGLVSGALAYDVDLKPGESKAVVLAALLHGDATGISGYMRRGYTDVHASADEAFSALRQDKHHYWVEQVDAVKAHLPVPGVAETLKSQVAYILLNLDGPAIQPGSRNYKRCWIRDGAMTSAALLRMGVMEPVRKYLDWYAERVQPDGLVPPILNNDGTVNTGFGSNLEYDSQGEFVYAIMEYFRFTGDRDFLQGHYERVKRALQYLVKLREQTLAPDYMKDEPAPERFTGILPKSISHEGYSPPMHSYWDDFWALKGWKDGREAAEAQGDTNTAAWAEAEYRKLREAVGASIRKTIEFKKIDFIPGCAEKGDPDATSTAIALFPCGEMDLLPGKALRQTFERYYRDVRAREEPGWSAAFTPYEIRNISAFVRLGWKDRASYLLDTMLGCRRPPAWNHWAEVVLGDARMGSYIGDMPHTWVGSSYVNAVRDMLAREDGGRLVLLDGAPESWLRPNGGISVEGLPTYFGRLSLSARATARTLTIKLGGAIDPPGGLLIRWPLPGKPASVVVDGYKWEDFDADSCSLPGPAREIIAQWPE